MLRSSLTEMRLAPHLRFSWYRHPDQWNFRVFPPAGAAAKVEQETSRVISSCFNLENSINDIAIAFQRGRRREPVCLPYSEIVAKVDLRPAIGRDQSRPSRLRRSAFSARSFSDKVLRRRLFSSSSWMRSAISS